MLPNLKSFFAILAFCACACASDLRQVGVVDLPGAPGFDQMALAKGMLLISHAGADTVDIFDPAKRRVIGRVTSLSQPRGLAIDEENGRVYIANSAANNLVVLSTSDFQVQRTIALPFSPHKLIFAPELHMLYVSCTDDQRLLSVDPQLGTATHVVDAGGRPEYLAFDPGRKLIYVTLQDKKKIQAFDPELKPGKSFDVVGSMPTGIVYDQQLDRLYVAIRNAVLAMDAKNGTEVSRVPAPTGIDELWLDAGSHTLFGAANGAVTLMYAGDRLTAVDELPVDVKGHTIKYDPKSNLIYVPGGREGHSKLLILRKLQPGAEGTPASPAGPPAGGAQQKRGAKTPANLLN